METRVKKVEKKEPNVWWTTVKLVIGAVMLIGGTGFLLWWASEQQGQPPAPAPSNGGWGIANDSPIRK